MKEAYAFADKVVSSLKGKPLSMWAAAPCPRPLGRRQLIQRLRR